MTEIRVRGRTQYLPVSSVSGDIKDSARCDVTKGLFMLAMFLKGGTSRKSKG